MILTDQRHSLGTDSIESLEIIKCFNRCIPSCIAFESIYETKWKFMYSLFFSRWLLPYYSFRTSICSSPLLPLQFTLLN